MASVPGEVARLIETHDWSTSPLGLRTQWPRSLQTLVSLALDSLAPTLLTWGPEQVIFYNDAARPLIGRYHPRGFGRPIAIGMPKTWERAAALINQALSGQPTVMEGIHFVDRTGKEAQDIWYNLSFSPVRDDNGVIAGAYCVFSETTDLVQRDTRRVTNERRYQSLFDSLDEGFCIIEFIDGPDGPLSDYVHIEANAAYAQHAGIPDVVGQKVRTMVPGEAAGWVELYGGVRETGKPIRFERELVATGRHLELAAFRIEPASLNQVAVLFTDITARKRAETALREANETLGKRFDEALAERKLFSDLIEATDVSFQVLDPQFRFLAINPAGKADYLRFYGVQPAIGQSLLDLLKDMPDICEAATLVWSRALSGETFSETSWWGEPPYGPRAFEMHMRPLLDSAGQPIGAYLFGQEVTARLKEQERLKEAEEALRQAQKMEAVGQLTGGLAHDFNNLLAGISGAFEMTKVRLAQGRSADVDKYLSAGQGAARRAAALTHRLLAFSRRQTLSPKPVVVNRLMADFVELVRRTVGPSIHVEMVEAVGLWTSLVDANQLENALLNLCINARDAMPDGGRITIETGNKWLDERSAKERNMEPGQYVTVCVSDTGTGIDKAIIERVFDPFFTTKPLGEGTGLGLSMVYGFARQSHGHVRIYSEVGQGTMVCVYLPRHFGDADAASDDLNAIAVHGRGTETIVIIDDEPTVRMLIVDALSDRGYACVEAADGVAGLRALESLDRIDLLITDVGLPGGLNGRQVADAARKQRPDLKVLFITGYAENAALNHGHVERGMQVLTKPFAVDDLIARVERMLGEAQASAAK